ncbi:MAG: phosphate signaling complex protein PhoU [Planctomycetaceae bacterium]|nr:phosphate signaling complex protein PhoU [Planctomycetaceae bacterium]
MTTSFRKTIDAMELDLISMGKAVEEAILSSVEALKHRDLQCAEKIIKDDELINERRWKLEDECINLIALQQPVASDLREVIAILNMITDLERMGDHAEGIAKIVLLLGTEEPVKSFEDIPQMAQIAADMLRRCLKAFVERDAKAAEEICKMDDRVDELHEKIYQELLNKMIENPRVITRATYVIWAAHNLERIADRVTNICERIVYFVSGSNPKDLNISRY